MAIKIKSRIGNLMHVPAGHIVHGCNAQGVMGSGVALGVKTTWPIAYKNYVREHEVNGLVLGVAYHVVIDHNIVVWNAITQNLYGGGIRQVSYDAIQTCFEMINYHLKEGGIDNSPFTQPAELHIPRIGAARGGGDWKIISTIIEETMDFPVTLWVPDSTVTTL